MGKIVYALFLLMILVVTLAGSVLAVYGDVPGVFHQLYGTVSVDGIPVPDGTAVQAKIGGDVYVTTTSGGKFGYAPSVLHVEDPDDNRLGKNIEILVNYKKVQDLVFEKGGYTLLELQTTTTCGDSFCLGSETTSSCPGDCPGAPAPSPGPGGTSGSGGGGGGGGGSGGGSSAIKTTSQVCIEQWECSDWSDCKNGKQKRLCRDNAACKTSKLKPAESRECQEEAQSQSQPEIKEQQKDISPSLLGSVIGAVGGVKVFGAALFIAVLIAGMIVIIVLRKKVEKKNIHLP